MNKGFPPHAIRQGIEPPSADSAASNYSRLNNENFSASGGLATADGKPRSADAAAELSSWMQVAAGNASATRSNGDASLCSNSLDVDAEADDADCMESSALHFEFRTTLAQYARRSQRSHRSCGRAGVWQEAGAKRARPHKAELPAPRVLSLSVTLTELYTGCLKRVEYVRSVVDADSGAVAGWQSQQLDVAVKPGWRTGTRLTYHGLGDELQCTSGGNIVGDLVVTLTEQPHPCYSRHGNDLVTLVRVPLLTALVGGEVPVPKLDGRVVKVHVTGVVSPGSATVLSGQGFPDPRCDGTYGALTIVWDVVFPHALDPITKLHLRKVLQSDEAPAPDSKDTADMPPAATMRLGD